MSHPAPEPAPQQHINQAPVPRIALFSHPPTAQALKQRHPPTGGRVDWRAVPFSAGQRRSGTADAQTIPGHRRQPAAHLPSTTSPRR
jgi:hypothetical protein